MRRMNGNGAYRAGVAVAAVTSFLIVWTTIVRDDGSGMGNFGVILAAMVAAFATRFQADGIARGMLGVSVMQALVCIAAATAPMTATVPDGVLKAWLFNGVFAALWLVSAACFYRAATSAETRRAI